MPRGALTLAAVVVALIAGASHARDVGTAPDPHLDPGIVPGSCSVCHRGHGLPGSPMLAAPQSDVCMECHDSRARRDRAVETRKLTPTPRATLLGSSLAQPYTHPISEHAFSRHEPGAVVCTSCHSPHRSSRARAPVGDAVAGARVSTRDPGVFEYEMCNGCHGTNDVASRDPLDVRRLVDPSSTSFHPIAAPSSGSSPSVRTELAGVEISCTDCHGDSTPEGTTGVHGSSVRHILRRPFQAVDGEAETPATYALCYSCHDRDKVLDESTFPEHRRHVVTQRASCATCHNPHGSVDDLALIRFGETPPPIGVSASARSGRLEFESFGSGSGACYVTCHGYDHGPSYYGSFAPRDADFGEGRARDPLSDPFGTGGRRQSRPTRER